MKTVVPVQALRAIAALSVVLSHWSEGYMMMTGQPDSAPLYPFAAGVDLFFVISGFVMVYSSEPLFGAPGAPTTFLRNRVARIVPIYWITSTIAIWPGWHSVPMKDIIECYLFIPIRDPRGNLQPLYGVGWTLNFEMYFYTIFAACLFFRRKIALSLLAALMLGAILTGYIFHVSQTVLVVWTDPIIIEFLFGVAIALLYRKGIRLPNWVRIVTVAVAAWVIWHFGPPGVPTHYRWAQWGIPAAIILAMGVLGTERWTATILGVAAKKLGDASYSLYLLHVLVLNEIMFRAGPNLTSEKTVMLLIFGYVAVIFLALFTYRCFERPVTNLLKKSTAAFPLILQSPVVHWPSRLLKKLVLLGDEF